MGIEQREIYQMHEFVSTNGHRIAGLDYLFLAAGSDYRAYEVLRKAKTFGISFGKVIIISFSERHNDNVDYLEKYKEYESMGFNYVEVETSIKTPSNCIKSLKEFGVNITESDRVGIDISCFTKPFFFSLMKYFQIVHPSNRVSTFYTEPKSYVFKNGLYDSFKSSSGPIRVEELPKYNGKSINEQERLLIIQLGFDGDLSREINEDVAPNSTYIINGFPGYAPKFKDISIVNNEKLVSNDNNKLLFGRANNPFDTYNLLDQIAKSQKNDAFINIAPLGTKPMALGACLFAIHNPKVRVVYPIPERYENVTTSECWSTWIYESPLSLN